jgi:hypothetical protein
MTRGRWERPRLKREQRLCQLCNQQPGGAVEDERHMVITCPFYENERTRLRNLLSALKDTDPKGWPALDLTDDVIFGVVMGILPPSSPPKPGKMAMMYCRQFLTTALRRRERQLASLKKRRSGGSLVISREPPVDAAGQTGAVVEAECIVDIADAEHDADSDHEPDAEPAAGSAGAAGAGDANVVQPIIVQ